MNSYAKAEKKASFNAELTGRKRKEKALREFKEVLHDLVLMLREATGMETVYLYWINRNRRQFVMETQSTNIAEVVFQDRVGFDEHFLNAFKDIKQPVTLQVGKDIDPEVITHYYEEVPVGQITLLPFINNEETVALTVVESGKSIFSPKHNEVIHTYINALGNVLNTYLEISDLYENQSEWVEYEDSLQFLNKKGHFVVLIHEMIETMQQLLAKGGVSLITDGMGLWSNVLNATDAYRPPSIGMSVEDGSVVYKALKSGKPEFSIHFNRNPKRLSPRELYTDGATLAIPVMFKNFRKAVLMVYDDNPLIFKESTKHKLINIVRLTGLKIQAKLKKDFAEESLLSNNYGAIIPDLWERAIEMQIQRLKQGANYYHSWVGMVTLSGLSQIRTQFRLDELELMQKDIVRLINPGNYGIPGFIGFHADYIYMVFLQSKNADDIRHWADEVKQKFSSPVPLTNGKQIETDINIRYIPLEADSGDSYRVVSDVKKALSYHS